MTYRIYWNSMDGQSNIDCGTFESDEDFDAIMFGDHPAVHKAEDMLIAQCGTEDEESRIRDGHFTVERE